MTATPRIIRTVAVPSAPRLRRVVGVNSRSVGRVSIFIAATCILGLTALCYLWQQSQAVRTAIHMPELSAEYNTAQNQQSELQGTINHLTSAGVVIAEAQKYGMIWNPSLTSVSMPGETPTRTIIVHVPARAAATARVHLSTSNAAVASWWGDVWVTLYHIVH